MASESIFVSSSLTCVKEIRLKLVPRPSHDSRNRRKRCQETENSMVLVGSSAHSYFSKNLKLVTIWEQVPNNSWHPRHSVMTSKAWCCSGQSLLPKSIRVHVSLSAAYHHRPSQINLKNKSLKYILSRHVASNSCYSFEERNKKERLIFILHVFFLPFTY